MNRSEPGMPGCGPIAAGVLSACQTIRLLLANRLLWLLLLGEGIAAVVAWAFAGFDRNRLDGLDFFCLLAWWFQAGVVLPWATLYLAVHAVHAEIEDRTFQYLFLRPVRRAPLLLGKWLAASLVAAVLTMAGGVLFFLAVAAHPETWSDGVARESLTAFLELLALGALAYASFGACFAACFRRPLVWAAVFVVLQTVVALLPVSAGIRTLTVADPLRRLLVDRLNPDRRLEEILWPLDRGLHEDWIGAPVFALALLTAILLLIGALVYGRAEYDSRQRE